MIDTLKSCFKSYFDDDRGQTAVEFALLALPFLLMMLLALTWRKKSNGAFSTL